jgi:serine/threonine-protein kinase
VGSVAVTDPPVPGVRSNTLEQRLAETLAGRYQIRKLLGQGGMGAVFLADDLELDRQVAIKVLPDASGDPSFVERFRREARTAARLDHPNIIPIYRVESIGDLHYFVMRYVPGQSLADVLADRPKLEVDSARRILIQAARALGHAHRHQIVHRDVKPANFMLEAEDRVVLTDFGISKGVQSTGNLTSTGAVIGTPSYMAPEQARGQPLDGRTDQYALGVVGFEMLAGRPPFENDDPFVLMFAHLHQAPPPLRSFRPDVPADLESAIARAMAKDPAARFESLEHFARALEGVGDDEPTLMLSGPPPAPTVARAPFASRRPSPRKGPLVVGIAVGLVTVIAAVLWLPRREPAGAAPPPAAAVPSTIGAAIDQPVEPAPLETTVPVSAPPLPPPPLPPPPPPTAPSKRDAAPAVAVAQPEPAPRVERARLTIGVDGSYATVYLDNELVGETPIVREVSFGEHEIRVEREGFKPIRQRVVVAGPTTRRFTLEPIQQP